MTYPLLEMISFIQVVATGSFTKAANTLGISKSIVSRHISTLEKHYDQTLLIRNTRKLVLTDVGLALYEEIKILPDICTKAETMLHNAAEKPQGNLKVIIPSQMSVSLSRQVIPEYLKKYPKVKLKLMFSTQVAEELSQDFDCFVLWKLQNAQFPDYPYIAKKIFTLNLQLFASTQYLAKHGTPLHPRELVHHNCVAASQLWPFQHRSEGQFFVEVNGNLETDREEVIHSAVVNSLAISYSYQRFFQHELNNGTVVKILEDYTNLPVEFYAFFHPTKNLSLKLRYFIEAMQSYYHELQSELAC